MSDRVFRIAFSTLGCKLNFAETSSFQEHLPEGFEIVPFSTPADIYVINTCTVTEQADKKGRNMISKAYRTNSSARIVVTGCQSQMAAGKLIQLPGVALVLGNEEKFYLMEYLERLISSGTAEGINVGERSGISAFYPAVSYSGRTRCFVKIQDGCDHFCAYCIVPYARGKSRSASVADVLEMVKKAESRGVKEIVLTGVNIGDFGKGTGESLAGLLRRLLSETSVPRIRLGSVEPELLSCEIIRLVAEEIRLMPHFHIPLQSGCDRTLKAMKRKYGRELVSDLIHEIKNVVPGAFIGADIIAGFPGESNDDFNETLSFISSLELSALHVFPYSVRPGTEAAESESQVPHAVKEERKKKLIELSEKIKDTFFVQNTGLCRPVLVERMIAGERAQGFTDNYIPVVMEAGDSRIRNTIVKVRLTGNAGDGKMKGEIAE